MKTRVSLTKETTLLFKKTGQSFAFMVGESGVFVDAENPSTIVSLPVEVISYMLDIKDDEGNKMFVVEEVEDTPEDAENADYEKESAEC